MAEIETLFAGADIDRATGMRHDAAALATAWQDPAARFLPVWEAQCLIRDGAAGRLTATELGARLPPPEQAVFLGLEAGAPRFAVQLASREMPADLGHFGGLRDLISMVPARDAALLAYARAMVNWHRQHRYCGACGAAVRLDEGGFVLRCTVEACGHRSFPRLDPAIIVLVHHDRHCLLGRQASWPEQRFSTIAGFVEPGESMEDAVAREVLEETGITVGEITYHSSQPWPFPSSLMLGFHAQATSSAIERRDGELEDAQWFSRADIAAGHPRVGARTSISWRLLESWFDAGWPTPLARLGR